MTGFLYPTSGTITFLGQELAGLAPAQIARLGLARTFQNIRLFNNLTVLENVLTAAQLHTRYTLAEALMNTPGYRARNAEALAWTRELLALMGLEQFAGATAGSLAYGLQRRLEIARALATRPRLLLLDEPAAGMNPAESDALNQLILDIRRRFDLTIILVEHDMRLVMNLCSRVMVLNYGSTIALGAPELVRNDPQVIGAYLGDSAATLKNSRD